MSLFGESESVDTHLESEEQVTEHLRLLMHNWCEKRISGDDESFNEYIEMEDKKRRFAERLRTDFPDNWSTYKLYHLLVGSTIDPQHKDTTVNFDFPDFGGEEESHSVQKFIEGNYTSEE